MNIVGEIRYHLDGQHATLKFSESRSSLSIDIVLVPSAFRGQGIGSSLIARILLLADSTRRPVFVDARPIGTNNPETLGRLVAYYRRFGFEETDRGLTVVHMRRPPKDDPRVLVEMMGLAAVGATEGTPGRSE